MTVYEYIRARWPNHAQRIIEAAQAQDRDHTNYVLAHEVKDYCPELQHNHEAVILPGLFIWANTPEGHQYWKALAEGGEHVELTH